jgi:Anti-sigma-K factor rskA
VNGHVSDDVPRLLTGDASRDEVMAAAAHLRECVDCQHELVSDVVAHASLRSAQRFAPEIVAELLPGVPDDSPDTAAVDDAAQPERPLPDLSAVFEQVRRETTHADASPAAQPRRRARWLVAAAAAVVMVGGGITIYEVGASSSDTGRTVRLGPFGVGRTSGTAHIDDGTITVDAASLPDLDNKFYEVWLTNAGRTEMQPVGWIGTDGTARISVRAGMLAKFPDLEVSVQDPGKGYQYSNVSVLRGSVG